MKELVYVTYIRTTPEKVWEAIVSPEFTARYWGGNRNMSDWKPGSEWKHVGDEGEIYVIGEVIASEPPHLLELTWSDPEQPGDRSRVAFEIEQIADLVRLRVRHDQFAAGSAMPDKVDHGWPLVLSSLKSCLETGQGIDVWAPKPRCKRVAA